MVSYDGTVNTNDGADRVKIYLNCLEETLTYDNAAAGSLNSIQDGDAPLTLGNFLNSSNALCGNSNFNYLGKLDDVRIYDRLLNAAEINTLCADTLSTSVKRTATDLVKEQIIIYPNPTQGTLNFKNISSGDKQVYIYDLQGKLLGEHPLQQQLEVNYLDNGLYLITVLDEKTGKISTQKIVVQK